MINSQTFLIFTFWTAVYVFIGAREIYEVLFGGTGRSWIHRSIHIFANFAKKKKDLRNAQSDEKIFWRSSRSSSFPECPELGHALILSLQEMYFIIAFPKNRREHKDSSVEISRSRIFCNIYNLYFLKT